MLLTTAYFPPIEYFALLAKCSISSLTAQSDSAAESLQSVNLEACESYQKQSYRNRCRILTGQGVADLRVPIVHNDARLITDILVDYSTPWVRQTKYAIQTAYSSSPFFEYYKDQLFAILDSRPVTLWELNLQIIRFFCAKIGINPNLSQTSSYLAPEQTSADAELDYRNSIHPKVQSCYQSVPYWQVFGEKFGFVPNLSIMDLLFNEGPESICYLRP